LHSSIFITAPLTDNTKVVDTSGAIQKVIARQFETRIDPTPLKRRQTRTKRRTLIRWHQIRRRNWKMGPACI
jgi:hypothetical protein